MRSMTGHGRGVAEVGGRRAEVEIRAVNHRYFDLKVRGPMELDQKVAQALRKRVERGAFTVSVRLGGDGGAPLMVNLALAKRVYAAFDELRRELGVAEPVPLSLVTAQPGVLGASEPSDTDDSAPVDAALEAALTELLEMRAREGATLAAELAKRFAALGAFADEIEARARAAPEAEKRRLRERLERLLAETKTSVNESRLEMEVALLADRLDVTEEVVRLRSHLAQARALLDKDAPVGRKLEFLLQELGREVNTIGSKLAAPEVTTSVVEAKAELEKLREQCANVE